MGLGLTLLGAPGLFAGPVMPPRDPVRQAHFSASLPPPVSGHGSLLFVVTARDGYAHIRSTPRSDRPNLVASVPVGMSVRVEVPDDGDVRWLRIDSPVNGWIHRSQVTAFTGGHAPPFEIGAGSAAIQRLAREGRSGNAQAATSFMLFITDGEFSEVWADALLQWAIARPGSLIALLKKQKRTVRDNALWIIYGELDISHPIRKRFMAEFGQLAS
jgi:hypothetical protein